ncbi:hypothetical protein ACFL0R_04985 [Pseudomonadota bacterium]
MNILIVCHAGAGLGLGHLTRSLVVASALLQERGADVNLQIQGNAVDKLKELMAANKLAASLSQAAKQRMSSLGGQKFVQAVSGWVT